MILHGWKKLLARQLAAAVLLFSLLLLCGETNCRSILGNNPYTYFDLSDYFGEESLKELDSGLSEQGLRLVAERIDYSRGSIDISLYGSEDAIKDFIKESKIDRLRSCVNKSFEIKINSFEQLEEQEKNENERVFFVSDKNAMSIISSGWIREHCSNIYGRSLNTEKQLKDRTMYVMLFFALIANIFQGFNLQESKKEILLKVSLGASKGRLLLKKYITDICLSGLLFLAASFLCSRMTMLLYPNIIVMGFFIYAAGLALIYTYVGMTYYKSMWADNYESPVSVILLGALWTITMTATVVVLFVNSKGIEEYQKEEREREFFSYFSEFNSVCVVGNDNTDRLYASERNESKALFYRYDNIKAQSFETDVLMYDDGSFKWLSDEYEEFSREYETEEKLIIAIPEAHKDNVAYSELLRFYFEYDSQAVELFYYKGRISAPAINGADFVNGLQWYENPVIMIDRRSDLGDSGEYVDGIPLYYQGSYLISEDELPEFAKGDILLSNVHDDYEAKHYDTYSKMKWDLVMAVITLLLDFAILCATINSYFTFNTKTLLIKKINGWTFIKRYRIIYGVLMLCFALALCIGWAIIRESLYGILGFIGMLCIFSFLVTTVYIVRTERMSFSSFIKGKGI